MKRWLRRIAKSLVVLLVLTLLIPLMIIAALQHDQVRSLTVNRILTDVNEELDGSVEIGSLQGSLLGHAQVHNLRILDARGNLAAQVDRADIDFRFLPLLSRTIVIDEIAVDGATVVVRSYGDHLMNWGLISAPEPEPEVVEIELEWQINLEDISIRDGSLLYMDETLEITEEQASLDQWRRQRIRELDAITRSTSLRQHWDRGFAAEHTAPLAGPRAPAGLWFDDLEFDGRFRMANDDMEAQVSRLRARTHGDIFPHDLDTALDDLSFAMGRTAMAAEVSAFELGDWLTADEFRYGMVMPPPTSASGAAADAPPDDDTFDQIVIDMGRWTVANAPLQWAMPNLRTAEPLILRGDLALDPDTLYVSATLELDGKAEPIAVALRLDDYAQDDPLYEATLGVDDFDLHAWLIEPQTPAVRTSLSAYARGEGFDPDTLRASLRLRLDDTWIDDTYEAELTYASIDISEGIIDAPRITSLTPYLDFFASLRFDPGGELTLVARTTTDDEQAARAAALSELPPARAELELDLDARFDPDFDELTEAIVAMDITAAWDFADFEAGDIRIAHSAGNTTASFEQIEGAALRYRGNYQLALTARDLVFGDHRAGYISVNDRGQFRVSPQQEPLIHAAEHLDNDAVIEVRNIWSPDFQIGHGQLTVAAATQDTRRRLIHADINADLQQLRSGDISGDRLQANANTQLRLGVGEPPVEWISTEVVANAQAIEANGTSVETIAADLNGEFEFTTGDTLLDTIEDLQLGADVSATEIAMREQGNTAEKVELTASLTGQGNHPTGEIHAAAHDIAVGDEEIAHAVAEISMLEEDRSGHLSLDIWRDDETYHLGTLVDYQPRFEAFELSQLRVATEHAEWLSRPEGSIRWTGHRIEADEFLLENDEQSLFASGHFQPDVDQNMEVALDIDVQEFLHDFYLQPLLPTIEGQIDVELAVAGTAAEPWFNVSASVSELLAGVTALDLVEIGPFSGHLSAGYADERLRIRSMNAEAYGEDLFTLSGSFGVALDMSGRVEVFPERKSDLSLQLYPRELRTLHEPLPVLNEYGIDGVVELDLDWSGTLAEPHVDLEMILEDFRFQGQIGDQFLNLRDVDLFTRLFYEPASVGGEGLDLSTDLNWEDDPILELFARTPMPIEKWIEAFIDQDYYQMLAWYDELLVLPFEFRLFVPSLDLERIPVDQFQEQNLAGIADIDVEIEGSLEDPAGHIHLDLQNVGWAQFRNFTFGVEATIRDHHIVFEQMDLDWANDEIFAGRGVVPLPMPTILAGEPVDNLPIDFRWQLHDIPISRLSAIDYEFARIDGYIGASLILGGSLRSPEIAARAGLFETRLGDGSPGDIRLEIRGRDDRVSVDGALTRNDEPFVSFDGEAPILLDFIALSQGADWQAPGNIRADIESEEMDLADVVPAQLLTNYILDPEGLFSVNAQIRGSWDTPRVTGGAELRDGAVTLPDFGRGFANINGQIDLDDEKLTISHFELHDGPSELELSGTVAHELLFPGEVDLSLNAEQFNIGGIATDFPIFVTADTTLRGTPLDDPGELDVHITNLNAVLTDEWDRTLHETSVDQDIIFVDGEAHRAHPLIQIIDEEPGEMEGIDLVVNIRIDRNAWARHPAGDLNFQAELDADISGTTVAITGNIDVLQGDLEFLGRRFNVRQSEVTFTGSVPPNPRLRIEAHHPLDRAITQALGPPTTGEARIVFRISGTAEHPRLQLQSDPAMTDTEILFVLMTGRPPDRTDVGRDEGVANQALSAVSGVFLGMLQDELAGTVPFDVLRLEPAVPGGRGGRLEVGTYVTNDIFFSYRHELAGNEQRAANVFRLEYHFLPRWMVEILYSDHNEGEFNLFWDAL